MNSIKVPYLLNVSFIERAYLKGMCSIKGPYSYMKSNNSYYIIWKTLKSLHEHKKVDCVWQLRSTYGNKWSMICMIGRFSIISPHVHFTPYHFTPYHFTPYQFTPHSFHPRFISPHVHFTPNSFHPTLKLSNASQINEYCHPISILALIEKRLGSNHQLDKQTMLAI